MPSKMLCPLQCHPVIRGTLTSLRMQVPRSFPGMNSVTSIICTTHLNTLSAAIGGHNDCSAQLEAACSSQGVPSCTGMTFTKAEQPYCHSF